MWVSGNYQYSFNIVNNDLFLHVVLHNNNYFKAILCKRGRGHAPHVRRKIRRACAPCTKRLLVEHEQCIETLENCSEEIFSLDRLNQIFGTDSYQFSHVIYLYWCIIILCSSCVRIMNIKINTVYTIWDTAILYIVPAIILSARKLAKFSTGIFHQWEFLAWMDSPFCVEYNGKSFKRKRWPQAELC